MRRFIWFHQENCEHKRDLILYSNDLYDLAQEVLDETATFWGNESLEHFLEKNSDGYVDINNYYSFFQKFENGNLSLNDFDNYIFEVADSCAKIIFITDDYIDVFKQLAIEFPFSEFSDIVESEDIVDYDNLIEQFNSTYGV